MSANTGMSSSKNEALKGADVPRDLDKQQSLQSAPHIGAQPQEWAEGHPDQATTALVYDLAQHADLAQPEQHDSSPNSTLLHSGSNVSHDALDEWILENLNDSSVRSKRVDVLTAAAKPIQYSHAEVLMTIGNIYDRNVE